jgi:hypothetical protein
MVGDINGTEIEKGDVVAPLNGDFRGRVSDVKMEDDEGFVCIRPAHRPYSKGIWYPSVHVQRVAKARKPPEAKDGVKKDKDGKPIAAEPDPKAGAKKVAKKKAAKKKAAKKKASKSKGKGL